MTYPYLQDSGINMSNGLAGLFQYANQVTNNYWSFAMFLTLYIIILVVYAKSQGDWVGGFTIAGWLTAIIGLFFWMAGAIDLIVFMFLIGGAIVGAILIFIPKGDSSL